MTDSKPLLEKGIVYDKIKEVYPKPYLAYWYHEDDVIDAVRELKERMYREIANEIDDVYNPIEKVIDEVFGEVDS